MSSSPRGMGGMGDISAIRFSPLLTSPSSHHIAIVIPVLQIRKLRGARAFPEGSAGKWPGDSRVGHSLSFSHCPVCSTAFYSPGTKMMSLLSNGIWESYKGVMSHALLE